MLINETTGEIAYHCLELQTDRSPSKFVQRPLKNNKGKIKFISLEELKETELSLDILCKIV